MQEDKNKLTLLKAIPLAFSCTTSCQYVVGKPEFMLPLGVQPSTVSWLSRQKTPYCPGSSISFSHEGAYLRMLSYWQQHNPRFIYGSERHSGLMYFGARQNIDHLEPLLYQAITTTIGSCSSSLLRDEAMLAVRWDFADQTSMIILYVSCTYVDLCTIDAVASPEVLRVMFGLPAQGNMLHEILAWPVARILKDIAIARAPALYMQTWEDTHYISIGNRPLAKSFEGILVICAYHLFHTLMNWQYDPTSGELCEELEPLHLILAQKLIKHRFMQELTIPTQTTSTSLVFQQNNTTSHCLISFDMDSNGFCIGITKGYGKKTATASMNLMCLQEAQAQYLLLIRQQMAQGYELHLELS